MNKQSRSYIIAEAGVNHNGSIDMALKLIEKAAEAGADAVKFQTFKTEKVISKYAPKADYQKASCGNEESQFEMVKKLELNEKTHFILAQYCNEMKIDFLSTPFDEDSLDFLVNEIKLPIIKIPSGEITNAPFLLKIAKTKKPVILSTGMSNLGEIEMALAVLAFGYTERTAPSIKGFQEAFANIEGQEALAKNVSLLHCTTEYPTPYSDVNLRVIDTLRSAFELPVGLSDHTSGISIPIAAAAKGAVIIEKHFTLDKDLPGPDHKASLDPNELKAMVIGIRQVEEALGSSLKVPAPSEIKNMNVARKSIVAAKSIKSGEVFTEENLTLKRPGSGVSPFKYWDILGKKAERDFEEDEVII